MAIEQLAEVRLAQPAVDARAHLDADDLRDDRRAAEPRGEIDLAEAALAEQPLDSVPKSRFRARDDTTRRQQHLRAIEPGTHAGDAASRGAGGLLQHEND